MPIPDFLIPLFGIIIPPLAKWLSSNGWPKWANEGIAIIIVLLIALAIALLTHSLSNNLIISFLAVAGIAAYLINGPLGALYKYVIVGFGRTVESGNPPKLPCNRQ